MNAAPSRDEWTTPRSTPERRVFAEECPQGRAPRGEVDEFLANARARAVRDAKILRGERIALDDVDPPYTFARAVLAIGPLPTEGAMMSAERGEQPSAYSASTRKLATSHLASELGQLA